MSWVARIPEIFPNIPLISADSMLNSLRMRKVKSIPLYLPADLRNRVELIAQQRRRAVSTQIVLWVEKKMPGTATMEDALALSKDAKLKDLLKESAGVTVNDYQITPMGVTNYAALSKLD